MTTPTRQVQQEIVGDRDVLIRIQEAMPGPAYVHPSIPAQYFSARICGNRVHDSRGPLWADLGEEGMERLLGQVAPEDGCAPQDALWRQFADKFDLDPTHYNTTPLIISLPAQPIIGGLSTQELLDQFIRPQAEPVDDDESRQTGNRPT